MEKTMNFVQTKHRESQFLKELYANLGIQTAQ